MKFDNQARYLETHEWARPEGELYVVGISDFAQEELGDIVYVELPEVGDAFDKGDQFVVVESVKAAGDVYIPLSGEVVEVNENLEDEPELINADPFGEGWLVKIKASEPAEWEDLMEIAAYKETLDE